jgi:methionyl-tRNA formyltransferase
MAPKLKPEDEWIDWIEPADRVWRRVRALAPETGAKTRFRERVLKVLRAEPVQETGAPGSVLEASRARLVIAAGEGALALEEVVPEGRKRMRGVEFARGQRLSVGDRFA